MTGVQTCALPISKAARLCYGLVKNHALVDGNKRIGVHAMLVFLSVNGYELEYTQKELSNLILDVAADKKQYKDLLQWLLKHQIYKERDD